MCKQTGHNEVIIQLGKHFNSYRRESHGLFYALLYSKFNVVFYTRIFYLHKQMKSFYSKSERNNLYSVQD